MTDGFVSLPYVGGPKNGEEFTGVEGLLPDTTEFGISTQRGNRTYHEYILNDDETAYEWTGLWLAEYDSADMTIHKELIEGP